MKLRKKLFVLLAMMVTLLFGAALTVNAASKACPKCGTTMTKFESDDLSRYHFDPMHTCFCPNASCDYYKYGKKESCTITDVKLVASYYDDDPKNPSVGHYVYKMCSLCGMEEFKTVRVTEAHTFDKDHKCACGYQEIIPGNTKVKSAKQSGKMTTIKGTTPGFWYKTYSGTSKLPTWHYQNPTKYNNKGYKIKFNLKKAKNVAYYMVSTKKNPNTNAGTAKQRFKKNTFTYNYISKKKVKSVTLYVTPVSRTENFGKTVKVKVKLK